MKIDCGAKTSLRSYEDDVQRLIACIQQIKKNPDYSRAWRLLIHLVIIEHAVIQPRQNTPTNGNEVIQIVDADLKKLVLLSRK